MPIIDLRLALLVQSRVNGPVFAEALLFPEVACAAQELGDLRQRVRRHVRTRLCELPPGVIYRRRLADSPLPGLIVVEVPQLPRNHERRRSVPIVFHYVQWSHGRDAVIAYVPALGIEVLAADEARLKVQLPREILAALYRRRAAESLPQLIALAEIESLAVRRLHVKQRLPTLKQAALRALEADRKVKSVLKTTATDLSLDPGPPIYERAREIAYVSELLTGAIRRSVLLVGPSGVGKTALVQAIARQQASLGQAGLKVWTTSGARLIAGMCGFGMWQDRCQKLVREASDGKAIVHLGNLVELSEVGKGGGNTQGMAAVLRPSIATATLLAIAECTPEQCAELERDQPQLLEAFTQYEVPAPSAAENRAILAQFAASRTRARTGGRTIELSDDALATLDRLHRRFATYSASPGRPLRFLRNLLEDSRRAGVVTAREITAAFSHETGLPHFMLEDSIPLDLAATRDWFAARVIGQPAAIERVVQLLAAVKAGLARGGRPIGSLLFIGPTGIGKTELAKALAEFLYQDPTRMIRFDMSEYAHPAAIERLIGGGASSSGLLTQRVRDQPFMVVLLDEFEKAHPLFFDILLQVLGEGRLTDAAGRVADFTNTVVIMTSNLGAESYRGQALGFGDDGGAARAERHFEQEVKAFLRPEMYNRLDCIVPFLPLDAAVLRQIAEREIAAIAKRDGLRFGGVRLAVDPAVVEHLAQHGADPRYGARPLKRAIERKLVAALADKLCRLPEGTLVACRVQLIDGELAFLIEPVAADRRTPRRDAEATTERLLAELVDLRRKVQRLESSSIVLRIRNEAYRIRQAEWQRQRRAEAKQLGKLRAKSSRRPPPHAYLPHHPLLQHYESLIVRVADLARLTYEADDQHIGNFYAGTESNPRDVRDVNELISSALEELLFDLDAVTSAGEQQLTLVLLGESMPRVLELCAAYAAIAVQKQAQLSYYWLKMYRPELDPEVPGSPASEAAAAKPAPAAASASASSSASSAGGAEAQSPVFRLERARQSEKDPVQKLVDVYAPPLSKFHHPPSDVIGVALQIKHKRAISLFATESGAHEFIYDGSGSRRVVQVQTHSGSLRKWQPPTDIGRRGALSDLEVRRTYHFQREVCIDPRLAAECRLVERSIDAVVAWAVAAFQRQRIWELLDAWN